MGKNQAKPIKPKPKMGRKTSQDPTRIWSFYCRPPTPEQAVLLREALFRANRYYNQRIDVEREGMDRYRDIRWMHSPELKEAEQSYDDADRAVSKICADIKKHRQKVFVRTGEKTKETPPELSQQLAEAKEERSSVSSVGKSLRDAFTKLIKPMRDALLKRRKKEKELVTDPHGKGRVNARTLATIVEEPEWPQAAKEILLLEEQVNDRKKEIRAVKPCSAPIGGLVETAADQAKKYSSPKPPRFHSFDGDGRIGGQIPKGKYGGKKKRYCHVADLFAGTSSLLRIRPATLDLQGKRLRDGSFRPWRGQRQEELYEVDINIGSDEKRKNVWVTLPVRIHRRMPEDALVKYAWILARNTEGEVRYDLQLTLESSDFQQPTRTRAIGGKGRVAVNFGWRRVNRDNMKGIRVACWESESGEHGEIVVPVDRFENGKRSFNPPTLGARLVYHEYLQGQVDRYRDQAVRILRLWMITSGSRWPAHIAERSMRSGRNRKRMNHAAEQYARSVLGEERARAAWQQWKAERLGSNMDLMVSLRDATRWARVRLGRVSTQERFAFWLLIWARKDRHLRSYQVHQEKRSRRQRDAFYREAALDLASEFAEVVTDDAKISDLAKHAEIDEIDEQHARARKQRHGMAPGECRSLVREVFFGRSKVVECKDNTRLCAGCGAPVKVDGGVASCAACGSIDADRNNCRNLLRRARGEWFDGPDGERSGDDDLPGGARDGENTDDSDDSDDASAASDAA